MASSDLIGGVGAAPRTLAGVFLILAGLAGVTTFVAHWYGTERLTRARQYFESGERFEAQGQEVEAITAYRNALTISRSDDNYRLALARALMKTNRLDEASIYLQEILQVDPADGESNLLLARIAARQGRTETAASYYRRAIFGYWKQAPEEERLKVRWELIDLLEKSGSRNQVVVELLQVPDVAPSNVEAKERAASLLLQYGASGQAGDIFREVLREAPHNAPAEVGLGRAELASGDYRAALIQFRRALHDDPAYEPARRQLALISDVLSLDPTARGIGLKEAYRRSRVLVERSAAALDQCLATAGARGASAKQVLDAARQSLAAKVRIEDYNQAAEANIDSAEQLWALTQKLCGGKGQDEALARVLEKLSI